MISRRLVVALAGLSLLAPAAFAQDWPSKPVTMIVPYNPGGTTDILARLAADAISAAIGQPVVVENKPGAGGVVGATLAAGAPNDGYTIFFGNNATNVVQPVINPAVSYDPVKSFDAIGAIANALVFIGVNADTGVTDLPSFIDYLKTHDAKYGTAGVGSMGQFVTEYFLQQTGTKATHIPYKGSNDAAAAILSDELQFMCDPVVTRHIGNPKMKVIATISDDRHPAFPDIPTTKELGYDVSLVGWFGLFAPEGTDPAIIAKMSAPLKELVASPAYQDQVLKMGLMPAYRDPAETDASVVNDLKVFAEIRDAAGIKID